MTATSLALFAGALLVLFVTPGPGIAVTVARTLDAGPVNASFYWSGILTGDVFWLTMAVSGLAVIDQGLERAAPPEYLAGLMLTAKLVGAGYLSWLAFQSFRSAWTGERARLVFKAGSKRGLAGAYLAGVAMPLSNPKPIAFYLGFVPTFFAIDQVGPVDFVLMVATMAVMAVPAGLIYIGGSHKARDVMASPKVRRIADIVTGTLMAAIAVFLLAQ